MRTMLSKQSRKSRVWMGTAVVAALAIGVLLGSSFAPRSEAAAQPVLNFSGGSGLLMNYVAGGATADFERVMRTYGEALVGSDNAQYNQMGSGLKVFRAVEPGQNNTVLYSVSNVNAPLVLDATMSGSLKTYARHNQAVAVSPFILSGAMSPCTVAGTLSQLFAEVLGGFLFRQSDTRGHLPLRREPQRVQDRDWRIGSPRADCSLASG